MKPKKTRLTNFSEDLIAQESLVSETINHLDWIDARYEKNKVASHNSAGSTRNSDFSDLERIKERGFLPP